MIQVKAVNLYWFHLLNPLQSFRGDVLCTDEGKRERHLCKIYASWKPRHGFCKNRVQLITIVASLIFFVRKATLLFYQDMLSEQWKIGKCLCPAIIPHSVPFELTKNLVRTLSSSLENTFMTWPLPVSTQHFIECIWWVFKKSVI